SLSVDVPALFLSLSLTLTLSLSLILTLILTPSAILFLSPASLRVPRDAGGLRSRRPAGPPCSSRAPASRAEPVRWPVFRPTPAFQTSMSYPTLAAPLVPLLVSVLLGVPAFGADDPPPRDTQPVDGAIPTPAEALASLRLPEGFRATLFASEPDVRQPIAFAFDERGRLWVAENYTYAEREVGFADDLRDRIVILEDEDGDGRADKRTVFADDLSKLTSIEIGLGGV